MIVETSRLTGIHLSEAALRDVLMRACRVDLASFGFSRLTPVTFEGCVLTQTDFLDTQLDSVRGRGSIYGASHRLERSRHWSEIALPRMA